MQKANHPTATPAEKEIPQLQEGNKNASQRRLKATITPRGDGGWSTKLDSRLNKKIQKKPCHLRLRNPEKVPPNPTDQTQRFLKAPLERSL